MRTETTTRTLYTFDELSEEAKEKAIIRLYGLNVDGNDWHDAVYEDAKEIGKLIGIEISKIYFSGFSSQSDGACFEGHYAYAKGSVKAVKDYAPKDETLHGIAENLQHIQVGAFFHLYANVKQRGHYMHENFTEIDVGNDYQDVTESQEEYIKTTLRDFMRWIYRQLEKEYEYLTSEEAIIESIKANEYEFTEDGKLV